MNGVAELEKNQQYTFEKVSVRILKRNHKTLYNAL
jgi:hypothetical protein